MTRRLWPNGPNQVTVDRAVTDQAVTDLAMTDKDISDPATTDEMITGSRPPGGSMRTGRRRLTDSPSEI